MNSVLSKGSDIGASNHFVSLIISIYLTLIKLHLSWNILLLNVSIYITYLPTESPIANLNLKSLHLPLDCWLSINMKWLVPIIIQKWIFYFIMGFVYILQIYLGMWKFTTVQMIWENHYQDMITFFRCQKSCFSSQRIFYFKGFVMDNFMCQLDWAMVPRYLVKHYFRCLCQVFLNDFNI